jgi:hypothetical protein
MFNAINVQSAEEMSSISRLFYLLEKYLKGVDILHMKMI